MYIPDEGLIEFNGVDREPRQLRQRRVAGAEIIKMNLRAKFAELLDHRERQLFVFDKAAFRELNVDGAVFKIQILQRLL